jgi:hypothetical protein
MKRTPLKRKTPMKRGGFGLKRTKLKQVSKRQASRNSLYSRQRREYLDVHPKCQVCGERAATDIHHTAGRGKSTNDASTFLAVCRECHNRIHQHPAWARENGYLAN